MSKLSHGNIRFSLQGKYSIDRLLGLQQIPQHTLKKHLHLTHLNGGESNFTKQVLFGNQVEFFLCEILLVPSLSQGYPLH